MAAATVQKFSSSKSKRESKRLLFYILLFAIPLLQFAIFYVYANFNSILISFQKYVPNEDQLGYTAVFVGIDNFKVAFDKLFSPSMGEMVKFSLIYYACSLLISTPLALFFSFYVAKNYRFSGFYRVMLYLPCVLSSVVLSIIFLYVCEDVYPYIVLKTQGLEDVPGLLSKDQTSQFVTLVFFNLLISFGTNTMLYTGSMTDINPSLIEASKLDGANSFHQFFHVYVPMIWPTLVTFIITGLAGVFIEQMSLYSFFGGGGNNLFQTFGYFFYNQSLQSNLYVDESSSFMSYPQLAALGIIVTVFLIPVVLVVRKLLLKYGPSSK